MTFLDIINKFKYYILFAISLVFIEDIAWIIEPTIFGQVIDSFIDKNIPEYSQNFTIKPLLIWIFLFLVNSGVGALRRSLDQKIYLKIYTSIVSKIATLVHSEKNSISKVTMRAELSREFITFFQYRIPEIIEQMISITGALIALAYFDWRISAVCLAILLPILLVNKIYNKNVIVFQKQLHDQKEDLYDVFSSKDEKQIIEYYQELAKPQQKIANWGAVNFAIMRFFLLIIFLVVIYIAIDLDEFTTGNFYSIVAYIWTFITASEYVPELLESWTSIKDIYNRLKVERF